MTLDSLHWEPNWVEAPDEIFRERVETALKANAWVVAGNYHVVRDTIWPKAQAIIWLDYPFHIVFWRLFTRTIRRVATKEKLFSGNVENGWIHLKLWSQESLFHWLFKTYWRRKREYPMLFALPEHTHLEVIHFETSKGSGKLVNKCRCEEGICPSRRSDLLIVLVIASGGRAPPSQHLHRTQVRCDIITCFVL